MRSAQFRAHRDGLRIHLNNDLASMVFDPVKQKRKAFVSIGLARST